jgi:hypothetical protein
MDEVARLIEAFGARGQRNQSVWKLDVLLDLGRFQDPRVVRFLVAVASDDAEVPDVRVDALRRLREAASSPRLRLLAATAGLACLAPATDDQLRVHAAIDLGDFVDLDRVVDALAALAANPAEPLELRYSAFTSLQRAGPTAACLASLRSLSGDECLGQSARALLTSWGAG